jgi:hypothetical protein
MKLTLTETIVTRHQVKQLDAPPGVTEVDFNGQEVYSGSAMHELIIRFRGAEFTHMPKFTRRQYEWVIKKMGLDES